MQPLPVWSINAAVEEYNANCYHLPLSKGGRPILREKHGMGRLPLCGMGSS